MSLTRFNKFFFVLLIILVSSCKREPKGSFETFMTKMHVEIDNKENSFFALFDEANCKTCSDYCFKLCQRFKSKLKAIIIFSRYFEFNSYLQGINTWCTSNNIRCIIDTAGIKPSFYINSGFPQIIIKEKNKDPLILDVSEAQKNKINEYLLSISNN